MNDRISIFEHKNLGFDVVSDSINNTVVSYADTDDLFKKTDESIESFPMSIEDVGKNLVFLTAISVGKTDAACSTEGFKDFIGASWDRFKTFIKKAFAAIRGLLEQIGNGLVFLKDKVLKLVSMAIKKNSVSSTVIDSELKEKRIAELETGETFCFTSMPSKIDTYETPVADFIFENYNMSASKKVKAADTSEMYRVLFDGLMRSSEHYVALCNEILLSSKIMSSEYCRALYDKMKSAIESVGFSMYSSAVFNNSGLAVKLYKLDLLTRSFVEEASACDSESVEDILRKTKNDGLHILTFAAMKSTTIDGVSAFIKEEQRARSNGIDLDSKSNYTASELFGANRTVANVHLALHAREDMLQKTVNEAVKDGEKITSIFKSISDKTNACIKRVEAGMELINFSHPTAELYRLTLSAYTRLIGDFSMAAMVSNYRYTASAVEISKFSNAYCGYAKAAFTSTLAAYA